MAVKYIPFFPEPIEGQALLNNFNRTLRYRGVEDLNGRLRRGMPFYVAIQGLTLDFDIIVRY